MAQSLIKMMQSADPDKYADMLKASARVNKYYCEQHNIQYVSFVGLKRGYFPWHACFNRIMMINEFLDQGYRHWLFYLDADAYVYDISYDVRSLLSDEAAMVAAPGGMSGKEWDINDGVFLINLGSEAGREIARRWYRNFMETPEEDLRLAEEWQDVPSDQPRLHRILRENPPLLQFVKHVPRELLNHFRGTFVRQLLRSNASSVEERTRRIQDEVEAILQATRQPPTILTHVVSGKTVSSIQYGEDYISEFKRILGQYASGRKKFLEWGAGYTTQVIAEFANEQGADLFLTIDANHQYLEDVTQPLRRFAFLRAEAPSMTGPCVNDRDVGLSYSSFPLSLNCKFDFIYIDGRRRMECALTAAISSNAETVVVLHDYRRVRYQQVRALFEVIEDGPQFRVMRRKHTMAEELEDGITQGNELTAARKDNGGDLSAGGAQAAMNPPAASGPAAIACFDRPVTREDILWCYRALLGRAPESESAIAHHMTAPSLERLILRITGSKEFKEKMAPPRPRMTASASAGAAKGLHFDLVTHDWAGRAVVFALNKAADDTYTAALRRGLIPQIFNAFILRRAQKQDTPLKVADFGANVGTVSLPLAAHGMNVLAVEPLTENFIALVTAAFAGAVSNLVPVNMAALDHAGRVSLQGRSAWAIAAGTGGNAPIPCNTVANILDVYGFSDVDIIKLDIEGAELAALNGAEALFSKRPETEVIFESNNHTCNLFGYDRRDLLRWFQERGFSTYVFHPSGLMPVNHGDPQPRPVVDILATKRPREVLVSQGEQFLAMTDEFVLESLLKIADSTHPHVRAHFLIEANQLPKRLKESPLWSQISAAL